jgi:hypothetical protein
MLWMLLLAIWQHFSESWRRTHPLPLRNARRQARQRDRLKCFAAPERFPHLPGLERARAAVEVAPEPIVAALREAQRLPRASLGSVGVQVALGGEEGGQEGVPDPGFPVEGAEDQRRADEDALSAKRSLDLPAAGRCIISYSEGEVYRCRFAI